MVKKLLWTALGVVLLLGAWKAWPTSEVAQQVVAPAEEGEAAFAPPPQERAIAAPRNAAERVALGADSPVATQAEPYGSVIVRAVWGDDHEPAEGVGFRLRADDDPAPSRHVVVAVTDAQGVARVERIHAGPIAIEGWRAGSGIVVLDAGGVAEVDFVLPVGARVEGEVVYGRGEPIAGAEVWLADGQRSWLGGRTVARTGADGRFALRALDDRHAIGVRARGFAPAPMEVLRAKDTADGATIHLRFVLEHPGGAVVGSVLDPDGRPVAGARVALDSSTRSFSRADGSFAWVPGPIVATTDERGAYELFGAPPGTGTIAVMAEGFPILGVPLEVPAMRQKVVDLVLEPPAVIAGRVRDEAGVPIAGAFVWRGGGALGGAIVVKKLLWTAVGVASSLGAWKMWPTSEVAQPIAPPAEEGDAAFVPRNRARAIPTAFGPCAPGSGGDCARSLSAASR